MKMWMILTSAGLFAIGVLIGCNTENANPPAPTSPTPAAAAKAPAPTKAGVMEEAAASRSPIVNRPAPDFTLLNQDDKPVTLSQLRGKWIVLYFYPQDDTPGCACQATEFTQLLTQMHNMNAEVYGISTDSTESHRLFIKKYDLRLNLLSDPNHKVMEAYGAWVQTALGDRTYGRVIRSTMIIDPNGIVRQHWMEVIPEGHAERVREKLAQIQAQSKPK